MIVFDLKCKSGHVFEAWFADSATFTRQKARKQVVCPTCGDTKITKAPMAPRIASGKSRESADEGPKESLALAADPRAQALMAKLRELKEHVTKNCDYVGERFPEEARKIHYGETEHRNIYGEASPEQAKELVEEGVEVQPLPWVPDTN